MKQVTLQNMTADQLAAVEWFYEKVCRQAERNMMLSLKLKGAHYAAMNSVIKELRNNASNS